MKAYAREFYKSKAWKSCRAEYIKRQHYLCENCLKQGIYKPAEIVHHKIKLTPLNIEHPEIALNFDNLEALCRSCHAAEHEDDIRKEKAKRFTVDESGKVFSREKNLAENF